MILEHHIVYGNDNEPSWKCEYCKSNKYDLKCLLNSAICVLTSTKILIASQIPRLTIVINVS